MHWALLRVAGALLAAAPGVAAAETNGWTSLFNGRDLTGWTVKAKPADRERGFWSVSDGVIVANSMAAGDHDYVWLVSDREYGDFVLRLQFQAFRDSPGNSGVQLRSRYDDDAGWLDGPQLDIHPPGFWRTGMIWDETRGVQRWLFPSIPKGQWVNPSMARPGLTFHFSDDATPWNNLEITARGTRVTALLNGTLITDYDGAGVLNDAVHRERRVGEHGHIALQIHTRDRLHIRYRAIALRALERIP